MDMSVQTHLETSVEKICADKHSFGEKSQQELFDATFEVVLLQDLAGQAGAPCGELVGNVAPLERKSNAHTEPIDVHSYDRYIVAFSGGKDSLAVLLHLLECGVPKEKIEVHHHNVDGEHTGEDGLMDWPVTLDYCRKVSEALGLRFSQSWREGGIERVMGLA